MRPSPKNALWTEYLRELLISIAGYVNQQERQNIFFYFTPELEITIFCWSKKTDSSADYPEYIFKKLQMPGSQKK